MNLKGACPPIASHHMSSTKANRLKPIYPKEKKVFVSTHHLHGLSTSDGHQKPAVFAWKLVISIPLPFVWKRGCIGCRIDNSNTESRELRDDQISTFFLHLSASQPGTFLFPASASSFSISRPLILLTLLEQEQSAFLLLYLGFKGFFPNETYASHATSSTCVGHLWWVLQSEHDRKERCFISFDDSLKDKPHSTPHWPETWIDP